jgi:predicted RNase H-like nuclease
MNYIGVDGCKKGWFYVSLDDSNNYEIDVIQDIQSLVDKFNNECLILVDIPIGLRHNGINERLCDMEARKVLGNRKTSVFPVPCRNAVYESTYSEASRINYQLTGKYISKQSWFISSRIRQVDNLLTTTVNRKFVREVHPEICFWGLNGGKSMNHYKRSPEGFDERLSVIRKVYDECNEPVDDALQKYKRSDLNKDDILDALVASVTARCGFNSLKTIPVAPEYDEIGLPMEMVYCLPNDSRFNSLQQLLLQNFQ